MIISNEFNKASLKAFAEQFDQLMQFEGPDKKWSRSLRPIVKHLASKSKDTQNYSADASH